MKNYDEERKMPTNKEIVVMVYAHPYTLMQYICKTPTHLVLAPPPLYNNGKFGSYQLLLLSFFNRIPLYAIFLLQYAVSCLTKVQISKNGDNLWQVLDTLLFCLRHLTNTSRACVV